MTTVENKPATLREAIAEQEKLRIASNLSNLASAYTSLGEENNRLTAQIDRNNKVREEILALEERDPATITLEETKELYSKAMNRKVQ